MERCLYCNYCSCHDDDKITGPQNKKKKRFVLSSAGLEEKANTQTGRCLPLGAVGVAGMALVVGLSIFEDEAVCSLQTIRAFLHTVGPVFQMQAFHAVIWTLNHADQKQENHQ